MLMKRVGVHFLVELYRTGFPLALQQVHGKAAWTIEEVLGALPISWRNEKNKGCYGAFPRKDSQPHNCYIGGAYGKKGNRGRISARVG